MRTRLRFGRITQQKAAIDVKANSAAQQTELSSLYFLHEFPENGPFASTAITDE